MRDTYFYGALLYRGGAPIGAEGDMTLHFLRWWSAGDKMLERFRPLTSRCCLCAARIYAYCSLCHGVVSVHLFVTCVHGIKTSKHILELSHLLVALPF